MPAYDGNCLTCGVVEIIKRMNEPWPHKCPQCKGNGFERIFNTQVNFKAPPDMFWENENKGAGKWMPQLGERYLDPKTKTKLNKNAFCRSRAEAIDRFKAKGFTEIHKD